MSRKSFIFVVFYFLVLIVGCEKPAKVEIIWGEVISINGHYYKDGDPMDCRIVAQFEETRLTTIYLIDCNANNSLTPDFDYNKCRKALLLKEGDRISAIKKIWADKITYELSP